MTQPEREAIALEKAVKLIRWFDDKPRPACPFELGPGVKILDIDKALEVLFIRVQSAKPYRYVFMSSYHHLLRIKKYIENVS